MAILRFKRTTYRTGRRHRTLVDRVILPALGLRITLTLGLSRPAAPYDFPELPAEMPAQSGTGVAERPYDVVSAGRAEG